MPYTLDLSFRSPLLPWGHVFWCLSVKQFSRVYEYLDFPFDPPENVRQIAHDFSLTWLMLTHSEDYNHVRDILRGNSETSSVDLLEGTSPNDPFAHRRNTLFTNTFAHLERIGYAEAIYRWGKHTASHYKHKYQTKTQMGLYDMLFPWFLLLRWWTVMEWQKQPIPPSHPLYSNVWDDVLAKYGAFQRTFILDLMPLSAESRIALQAIVLNHAARQLQLETITDEIWASSRTVWEDVALRAGAAYTFFKQEGNFRIETRLWHAIENLLSTDELHLLEQWAMENKKRSPHFQGLDILPQQFRDYISGKFSDK
jgi:hypothetical protein